jgi:hypothetical protein
MQVDLSDKKIFELVQRSDTKIPVSSPKTTPKIIDEKIVVDSCKREGSLTKFMKKLFILIFVIVIIYFTIFRYILGYRFFKNKEYKKGTAVLSPEIITLSALLL